jgi:hypothetical protein
VSIFKETIKKVPWWAWVLFPVALLLLVLYFLRDKGRGVWPWAAPPPSSDGPAPVLTPKEAEKKREEIKEELKAEEEKVTSEADALRKKIEEKFGPRPKG